jgi:predicted amidohydrolase
MGDIEYNTKGLTELCIQASNNGAKFIVLPETSVSGYLSQDIKTNWRVPGKPIDRIYSFEKNPER